MPKYVPRCSYPKDAPYDVTREFTRYLKFLNYVQRYCTMHCNTCCNMAQICSKVVPNISQDILHISETSRSCPEYIPKMSPI